MSLFDAFLCEPVPIKTAASQLIHVSHRPDQAVGSGTAVDPYNGTTQYGNTLDVGLTWEPDSSDGMFLRWFGLDDSTAFIEYLTGPVVNGSTSTPHGYTNGAFVEIQGATGPEADLFEHTFPVSVVSSTDFSFEVIAAEGDDIQGVTTCRKVVYPIDAIMASLPSHSIALFGTGVFETRGVAAWGCKVAQKLRGSGMDATVLKLVSVGIRSGHNLGSQFYDVPLNYVEFSDLTVDCNMRAHPYGKPYSRVFKSGINLVGSFTRLRRCRVIDFGTHEPLAECFALTLGGAHPYVPEIVNPVIEECIVEHPWPDNVRETTTIGVSGLVPPFHRAAVLRDCVVDVRYATPGIENRSSMYIRVLSITPNTSLAGRYRITTSTPHNRVAGGNVSLWGIQLYKPDLQGVFAYRYSTALRGSYVIPADGIISSTALEFLYDGVLDTDADVSEAHPINAYWAYIGVQFHGPGADGGSAAIVRGNRVFDTWFGANHDTFSTNDIVYAYNYYSHARTGPLQNMGGQEAPQRCSLSRVGNIATVTIAGGHRFLPGQAIQVTNVRVAGAPDAYFNGYFEIVGVAPTPSINGLPTTLTYVMAGVPSDNPSNNADAVNFPLLNEFWTVRQFTVARNIIELAPSFRDDVPSVGIAAAALLEDQLHNALPYVYGRIKVRDNVIRQFRDRSDTLNIGIGVGSSRSILIDANLFQIACSDNRLVQDNRVTSVGVRYNMRTSGKVARGWEFSSSKQRDDVSDNVMDALSLTF